MVGTEETGQLCISVCLGGVAFEILASTCVILYAGRHSMFHFRLSLYSFGSGSADLATTALTSLSFSHPLSRDFCPSWAREGPHHLLQESPLFLSAVHNNHFESCIGNSDLSAIFERKDALREMIVIGTNQEKANVIFVKKTIDLLRLQINSLM